MLGEVLLPQRDPVLTAGGEDPVRAEVERVDGLGMACHNGRFRGPPAARGGAVWSG